MKAGSRQEDTESGLAQTEDSYLEESRISEYYPLTG